jgi:uncharacterized membrane protein YsdA (DUF1294 family)
MPGPMKKRHPSPVLYHLSIALAVAAVAVVALWWGLGRDWTWHQWLIAWLVVINGTAFAYYGIDKAQARRASRRVPELVLHALALAGGSAGAYAGMQLFRHKTLKGGFRIIFWLIVAVQVVVLLWAVKELWLMRKPTTAGPRRENSSAFCLAAATGRVKWVQPDGRTGGPFAPVLRTDKTNGNS